jgi:hypothetical protein
MDPFPAPTCLKAFRTSPAESPGLLLDTLTDWPNRFHAVTCRCGGTIFHALGEIVENELIHQKVVKWAVTVECAQCRQRRSLFDPSRHGYDIELDHFPVRRKAAGEQKPFPCPHCRGQVFSLIARFEYPPALLDAVARRIDPGYPEHKGREQDLFTFFTLIGNCRDCQTSVTISSVSCA